jgi:hypothetical protein
MSGRRKILFEGKLYAPRAIGRISRRGSGVFAEINGLKTLLHAYDDPRDAELGRKYLLARLDRRAGW